MRGYYYLHSETKDLIYKPAIVVDSDPSYFDSPFVQKVWGFDSKNRIDAWVICVEALALGAKIDRVFELKGKWGLTDEDAQKFISNLPFILEKDGDIWCVKDSENFINIQESQVGFGDTALEAIADFAKQGKGLQLKD